ncbi:hypothetical protein BROUX41_001085 [Berkeleyomyces rouxiae]|uniref:uncharacterized protein n=1 Tax=Berkeleyomyces rouxiae TaxID=2035830 RepID=UPI003B78C71D
MGWFGSSKAPEPSQAKPTALPSAPTPSTSAESNASADPEIQKFVDLFTSDTASSTAAAANPQQPAQAPSTRPYWLPAFVTAPPSLSTTDSVASPPALAPIAEAILPTEMSCSQAFDMAFACQSLGGQWTSIYRTGEMRSCSELWSDFWFCMRHNGSSGPVTENLIRGHYRRKEWDKYYAPGCRSSEDVWRSRDDRVPLHSTFKTPVPIFDEAE